MSVCRSLRLRHFCVETRSSITDPGSDPHQTFFLFLHKWFLVHASHLQYGSHLQSLSTLVSFNATWCFGHQADTGFFYPDGEIRRKSAGYQDGTGSVQIFFPLASLVGICCSPMRRELRRRGNFRLMEREMKPVSSEKTFFSSAGYPPSGNQNPDLVHKTIRLLGDYCFREHLFCYQKRDNCCGGAMCVHVYCFTQKFILV